MGGVEGVWSGRGHVRHFIELRHKIVSKYLQTGEVIVVINGIMIQVAHFMSTYVLVAHPPHYFQSCKM